MPSTTLTPAVSPARWRHYVALMRLDRPVGIWLLLFPGLWGLALHGMPDLRLVLLFIAGAVVMRSAGCVLNDLADRRLDAAVSRTASRPLACGAIRSGEALVLLAVLLATGLAVLLQFNLLTRWLGVASVALVVAYPFMKRITWWPQLFLGITFNWGVLMAGTAVTGEVALPALLLYAGCIFWTLGYDTVYAYQDREDDMLAGIKSSARRLGTSPLPFLQFCYLAFLLLAAAAGYAAEMHPLYYLGVLAAAMHCAGQLATLNIHHAGTCLRLFKSNVTIGWLLLAGLLTARLFGPLAG